MLKNTEIEVFRMEKYQTKISDKNGECLEVRERLDQILALICLYFTPLKINVELAY